MAGNDDFSRFLEQRRKLGELSGQNVDDPLFQRQVERAYKKGQRYDPKLAIEIKQTQKQKADVRRAENLFPQRERPGRVKITDRGIIRGRCEIDIHNGGINDALALVDSLPAGVWVWIKAFGLICYPHNVAPSKQHCEERWTTLLANTPKEQVRNKNNIARLARNLNAYDDTERICVSYRVPRSRQ